MKNPISLIEYFLVHFQITIKISIVSCVEFKKSQHLTTLEASRALPAKSHIIHIAVCHDGNIYIFFYDHNMEFDAKIRKYQQNHSLGKHT